MLDIDIDINLSDLEVTTSTSDPFEGIDTVAEPIPELIQIKDPETFSLESAPAMQFPSVTLDSSQEIPGYKVDILQKMLAASIPGAAIHVYTEAEGQLLHLGVITSNQFKSVIELFGVEFLQTRLTSKKELVGGLMWALTS